MLLKPWASMKSFQHKEGGGDQPASNGATECESLASTY
jgi:hypothetical protein